MIRPLRGFDFGGTKAKKVELQAQGENQVKYKGGLQEEGKVLRGAHNGQL